MKEIYKRTTCRLCDSKYLVNVFSYAPSPLCDAYVIDKTKEQAIYPLDLYLCKDCGLAQLLDVVNPEIIYRDYIYVTTSSMGLDEHFKHYALDVLQRIELKKGAQVVDIGCNDATLLKCFKKSGLEVMGVEPACEIAKLVNEGGIECVGEFFNQDCANQIVSKKGKVDLVTANNLLANIDDLHTTVQNIRYLLNHNGVFTFESYYLADLIENKVFDFIYHEHISSFAVKPIQSFFRKLNMHLFDIQRVPTKGGSLRCYVQLEGGARTEQPIVSELIEYENHLGIYDEAIYHKYYQMIGQLKSDLNRLIDEYRKKGKVVAGFGASATTTTFIYHLGLTEKIDYLIDDNVVKQNTFSPGCHLPVYSSEVLYERQPDFVLIIAWRYANLIIQKQQPYLEQGGTFIIPLPDIKFVPLER